MNDHASIDTDKLNWAYVLCEVCGEHLEHKMYFAEEHMKETGHMRYSVKPKTKK